MAAVGGCLHAIGQPFGGLAVSDLSGRAASSGPASAGRFAPSLASLGRSLTAVAMAHSATGGSAPAPNCFNARVNEDSCPGCQCSAGLVSLCTPGESGYCRRQRWPCSILPTTPPKRCHQAPYHRSRFSDEPVPEPCRPATPKGATGRSTTSDDHQQADRTGFGHQRGTVKATKSGHS